MPKTENNTRRMLLELGIGDFNATMILPYMFMGPAQTDPAMAQVQLLVKAMQRQMIAMGATWIRASGKIDIDTAHCLQELAGPHWNQTTYVELVNAILIAKRNRKTFAKGDHVGAQGIGFLPDLPDVPGGIITYGIVGYLLYRHFKKGR